MTIVATLYEVHCHFEWEEDSEVSTWHCATLDGAHRFIEKQKTKGLMWYSIEGQDFIPCNEDDPDGQLYIGMKHFEFKELKDGEWR